MCSETQPVLCCHVSSAGPGQQCTDAGGHLRVIAKASYAYPVTQPPAKPHILHNQSLCGLGSFLLDNCWQHYFLPDTHTLHTRVHKHTQMHTCTHTHVYTNTQTSMYKHTNEQKGDPQEEMSHMRWHMELLSETRTPGVILSLSCQITV